MGGGLESRCIGHVYGADGAVSRTQHLMLLMMCICNQNMSS